jgi:hypothetical protein
MATPHVLPAGSSCRVRDSLTFALGPRMVGWLRRGGMKATLNGPFVAWWGEKADWLGEIFGLSVRMPLGRKLLPANQSRPNLQALSKASVQPQIALVASKKPPPQT